MEGYLDSLRGIYGQDAREWSSADHQSSMEEIRGQLDIISVGSLTRHLKAKALQVAILMMRDSLEDQSSQMSRLVGHKSCSSSLATLQG